MSEMTGLSWSYLSFSCLVAFFHFCKHTTCAPLAKLTESSSITTKLAFNDNLIYANFHPDLRIINLATDLMTKLSRNFYFEYWKCTEKQYLDMHLNKYPLDCQLKFNNATTLKDLVVIYCDPLCGTYLNYIMKNCGQTALEMSRYYRELCFK